MKVMGLKIWNNFCFGTIFRFSINHWVFHSRIWTPFLVDQNVNRLYGRWAQPQHLSSSSLDTHLPTSLSLAEALSCMHSTSQHRSSKLLKEIELPCVTSSV